MPNRVLVAGFAAVSLVAASGSVQARHAKMPAMSAASMSPKTFMKRVNGDADKTISKVELDAYAKKRFAALESDNDKTLDAKELKGRLTAAGMATADPDKDKAIDETEFVTYADKLFDEANSKGDKTLSVAELRSPAGKKLITLLH